MKAVKKMCQADSFDTQANKLSKQECIDVAWIGYRQVLTMAEKKAILRDDVMQMMWGDRTDVFATYRHILSSKKDHGLTWGQLQFKVPDEEASGEGQSYHIA